MMGNEIYIILKKNQLNYWFRNEVIENKQSDSEKKKISIEIEPD